MEVTGFLHLFQGALMIAISNDITYPIFTNYLIFDIATRSLAPNPQLLYELRFGPAVAAFLLISAIAHFYLATIGFPRYIANLKQETNPVRFYEYALSSSAICFVLPEHSTVDVLRCLLDQVRRLGLQVRRLRLDGFCLSYRCYCCTFTMNFGSTETGDQ